MNMMPILRAAAALSMLLVLVALPATAAEPTSKETSDTEPAAVERAVVVVQDSLPYIPNSNTISTKLPVELKWTPANVGVVTSEVLREQNDRVLGKALENVSGVNAQTFNGIFDLFFVRGFDSVSSGLVLIDGAPEPEATFYQMYNTERVELFKGPAGFLYGSNPLAGAVDIVRRQPMPLNFGSVSVAGGSFATYEGKLDVNRSNSTGDLSFRLNGLWRESDGYRDRTESQVGAINPALTWNPSERSTLNFNLEILRSDHTPDAGIPIVGGEIPDVDRETSWASPFDSSEQDVTRFQIDYQNRLSDKLQIRNKLYGRGLDWETDGTLLVGAFPTPVGTAVARTLLMLDDRQDLWGNQFEAVFAAETGSVKHDLLAGLEISRFTDEFTLDVGALPLIGLDDPIETAQPPVQIIPGQSSSGDVTSDVIAPYVVDQITFSEKVQMTIGLRWDSIDFSDDVRQVSRSDGELSPFGGITFSPVDSLYLYGNVASSFAPPSPRATGGVEPEKSRQVEVGVRKEWLERRIRGTFALYQLERDNIAIPDDNGFTQQIGDQRSRGFELDLAVDLPGGLQGLLAYSYTDAELTRFTELVVLPTFPPSVAIFDRSGNTPAFVPKNLARLWLGKRLTSGFWLAGGLRWVDDQFIAEDNTTRLDGYLLVDAALAYELGKWRFSANLENITDQEYETRGFGSSSVIPGSPVAVTLGIERGF